MRDLVGKLKFGAIWTIVGLAALAVLAVLFWPALLGLAFVGVLLFAVWRTRDRMGWAQALVVLSVLTVLALIFWRVWVIIAMAAVIALLAVRAIRLPRPTRRSSST